MTKLFDPAKPVQTRDGCKARIICTDRVAPLFPIVALVMPKNGKEESILRFSPEGRSLLDGDSAGDLVNVPVRTSTWQNVYANALSGSRTTYPTKDEANSFRVVGLIGHIRRDFEDGVFVGAEFVPLGS